MWTLVGVLTATVFGMFGMFFYLGSKMDAGFGRIDGRLDAMSARIDRLDGRLSNHVERHAA